MSVVGLEESEKLAKELQNRIKRILNKEKKQIQLEIDKIKFLLGDKQAINKWKSEYADNTKITQILSQLDDVERLYLNAGDTKSGKIFKERMTKELNRKLTNYEANKKEIKILSEKFKAQTKSDTLDKMTQISREGSTREMYQQSRNAGGFLSNFGKAFINDAITMETHSAGSKTIGEYMENLYNTYENGLKEVLLNGIVRGDSYKKMINTLQNKTGITARKADLLIRTEANSIFNNSVEKVIKDNPLVKGYRFRAVLDSRTSKICQQHDGYFIPKEEMNPGVNYPPLHPNCRSTVTTVLYNEDERNDTMQRYTKNGSNEWVPVPKGMTYLEFKDKFGFNNSINPRIYKPAKRIIENIELSKITINEYKGYVKPSVNATKTIDKMINAYLENDIDFINAVKKNTGYNQEEKALIRQAQAETGFDGLPLQQSAKSFTKEVEKNGYKLFYRQFNNKEDKEQFLNGTQLYNKKNNGVGIYVFDEVEESKINNSNYITMAFKSSENKILDATLFNEQNLNTNDYRINNILLKAKSGKDVFALLNLLATEYGYDTIKLKNENNQIYYEILNRTSLIIKGE